MIAKTTLALTAPAIKAFSSTANKAHHYILVCRVVAFGKLSMYCRLGTLLDEHKKRTAGFAVAEEMLCGAGHAVSAMDIKPRLL